MKNNKVTTFTQHVEYICHRVVKLVMWILYTSRSSDIYYKKIINQNDSTQWDFNFY